MAFDNMVISFNSVIHFALTTVDNLFVKLAKPEKLLILFIMNWLTLGMELLTVLISVQIILISNVRFF